MRMAGQGHVVGLRVVRPHKIPAHPVIDKAVLVIVHAVKAQIISEPIHAGFARVMPHILVQVRVQGVDPGIDDAHKCRGRTRR